MRSVRRCLASMSLVLALATAVVVGAPGTAFAHETREVGDYVFTVGFGEEPAYAGLPNSVQLILSDLNEEPVVDLEDTLQVDVGFGEETVELELEPRFVVDVFGTPGEYGAFFVPTRPGQYTFHFHGSIHDQEVDEVFTSGPETFNDVQDPQPQMFPIQDPTAGQLSERLEREVARLGTSSDGVARALGVAGVVLGGAALVTSIAMARRKV